MKIFYRILLITTILFIFTKSLHALRPERGYLATPLDYGIIYKEVTFKTTDGLNIKGWFFPAQDTAGIANHLVGRLLPVPDSLKCEPRPYRKLYEQKRPTIVICDGDAGNMTYSIFYSYHLFTKGFNVFTFDWRGFGESDEWPMERDRLSYTEFLLDYEVALDFLKEQSEVDSTKIGVFGFSTGAYLSFAMIAKRKDIAAYAGRALLTSFDELLHILKKVKPNRNFKAPEGYPKELIPINAAKRIDIPVYLIVGEKDDRTPPWMSEKIFKELKGPKELWIVPEASHGGVKGPEMINYPEFFIKLTNFFAKYLS